MDEAIIERWLPLIKYLEERTSGFGEYLLQIHGKRPVGIQRVSKKETLPLPAHWSMNMIGEDDGES